MMSAAEAFITHARLEFASFALSMVAPRYRQALERRGHIAGNGKKAECPSENFASL
jgi:hypothetical protein